MAKVVLQSVLCAVMMMLLPVMLLVIPTPASGQSEECSPVGERSHTMQCRNDRPVCYFHVSYGGDRSSNQWCARVDACDCLTCVSRTALCNLLAEMGQDNVQRPGPFDDCPSPACQNTPAPETSDTQQRSANGGYSRHGRHQVRYSGGNGGQVRDNGGNGGEGRHSGGNGGLGSHMSSTSPRQDVINVDVKVNVFMPGKLLSPILRALGVPPYN